MKPFDTLKLDMPQRATGLRPRNVLKRFGPQVVDARLVTMLSIAVAVGWFFIEWNAQSLRLVVNGNRLGWLVIVSFGIVWMAGQDTKWRTAGGMIFGAIASIAAIYGAMSYIPLLPIAFGVWLGLSVGIAAAISLLLPRLFSFAAMAVGFGLGIGVAVSSQILPTTSASEWFNVVMTMVLGLGVGVIFAEGLHLIVDSLTRLPAASTVPKSARGARPPLRFGLHRTKKVS